MSYPTDPGSPVPPSTPPRVLPVFSMPSYPPPPPRSGAGRVLLVLFLIASMGLNIFLLCGGFFLKWVAGSDSGDGPLHERFHSGTPTATSQVAVIRIDGPILEGQLGYVNKQIELAAADSAVQAVVVRIDSPGGSISASDDLHRRLSHLRDGTTPKFQGRSALKKPLVVSMGGMAASGGYYIAMPAAEGASPNTKKLFAERTTITGSIGVYASFINAEELTKKYGVGMELIKAGAVKGSGSLFYKMTPQERQPWADMVEQAYRQFISIVEAGRPSLKDKLTEDLFAPKTISVFDDRGNVVKDDNGQAKTTTYTRQRADGGVFTAEEALKWGLIDAIGTLDDAVAEAARQANLATYKAITYDRPLTLMGLFGGTPQDSFDDRSRLAELFGPRIWYLVPGGELSIIAPALGRMR
jgi:protease IV